MVVFDWASADGMVGWLGLEIGCMVLQRDFLGGGGDLGRRELGFWGGGWVGEEELLWRSKGWGCGWLWFLTQFDPKGWARIEMML